MPKAAKIHPVVQGLMSMSGLSKEEVEGYLAHTLAIAKEKRQKMTKAALYELFRSSQGPLGTLIRNLENAQAGKDTKTLEMF